MHKFCFALAKLFERRRSRSRTLYIYHIIIIFSVASTAFAFIPFCAFPVYRLPQNFSCQFRFSTFSSTSLSAKKTRIKCAFCAKQLPGKAPEVDEVFLFCVCVCVCVLAATVTGISIIVCYNSRLGQNVKIYFISVSFCLWLRSFRQRRFLALCVCVCLRLCTGCCHLVGYA